jgi:hypothetical protein
MALHDVASAVQQLPQLKALLRLLLTDGTDGTDGGAAVVRVERPSAADTWRLLTPDNSRDWWETPSGLMAALLSGLRAVNAGLSGEDSGRLGRATGRPAAALPLGDLVTVTVYGDPAEVAHFRALGEELAHWGGVGVDVISQTGSQEHYAEAVGALLRGAAGVVTWLRLDLFSDEERRDPMLAALLRWGWSGRGGA